MSNPQLPLSARPSRSWRLSVLVALALPGLHAATVFDLDPASPSAGASDVNALSFNGSAFTTSNRVFFSVDRLATGLVGTGVFRQVRRGAEEAHGDVFLTNPRGNVEHLDEQQLGLIPGFFGDDLDALEVRGPSADTYFSVDFLSLSNNFGASEFANDIFLNSLSATFASGELDIGLVAGDDIDALHLYDTGIIGSLDPGLDRAVFSLNAFSPTVIGGAAAPGDLLVTTFDGTFSTWRSAAGLGLGPADELNALSIPEPSTLAFLLTAGAFALRRRRFVA